jgi:hypothetical protein
VQDVHATDAHGRTALWHVDRPSKRGVTPLFLACAAGHTDVAQLLLFSGMIDTAATWLCVQTDQPRVVCSRLRRHPLTTAV